MIKKIGLFTLFLSSMAVAFSQSPDYGDKFLRWVEKDLPAQSQKLAEEDVSVKWITYFNVKTKQRFELIHYVDSSLAAMQKAMYTFERAYDSLQKLPLNSMQQLQLAIERYENTRSNQIKLNNLGYFFLKANEMVAEIDSAVSVPSFIHSGLVYAGRELLFESVLRMGNNLANTASDKFSVSVSGNYQESADGNSGEWSGNAGMGSVLSASMLPFFYERMVEYYGAQVAATYIPYVAIVVMAYQYYQSDQELKQMQKVYDGLRMLKDKIISADSLHRLSDRLFHEEYAKRAPLLLKGTLFLDTLTMHWKQAVIYNTARYNAASHLLTAEKMKTIEQQYSISDSLKAIFDQELLNEVILYSNRRYLEMDRLWRDSLSDFQKDRRCLLLLDQFEQKRETLSLLVDEWESNRKLIPIYPYLNLIKSELLQDSLKVIGTLTGNKSLIPPRLFPKFGQFTPLRNKSVEVAEPMARRAEWIAVAEPDDKLPGFYYLNYNGASFGLGYEYGNYEASLNNGGANPLTDILGSVRDGGFATDNVRGPYGVQEINKARNNINDRIELLRKRKEQLEVITGEWERKNTAALNDKLTHATNLLRKFNYNETSVMHEWGSGAPVVNLPNVIPFRSVFTQPARQLPVPGVSDIAGDHPLRRILTNNGLQYEMFKRDLNTTRIRQEIAEYYAAGKPHPVFATNADFLSYGQRLNQVSRYASVFNNKNTPAYTKYPLQCEVAASHHLDNMKLLRFYSNGWISEATLNEASVLNPELYAYEIGNMLKEFGNSCNDADAPGTSPCNIYASMALNRIYGLNEFYTVDAKGNKHYMAANQIFSHLSKGAPGWKAVGPATIQQNLYDAAFYASQGRAVVYVSPGNPNGHIAIGMPSLCEDVSGGYYAGLKIPKVTSFFLGKPENSFYNRPVSYAWSDPRGVMIFVKEP